MGRQIFRGLDVSQRAVWGLCLILALSLPLGALRSFQRGDIAICAISGVFWCFCFMLLADSLRKKGWWYRSLYRCEKCGNEQNDSFYCRKCWNYELRREVTE